MHEMNLIPTLAGGLAAALFLGFATHRLGLSPIVGYLLAGILVGPHTPGFVADRHLAEQLAEVGVILLMFGVGLQFHLKELLAVKGVAIPGAIFQSATATLLGYLIALRVGWTPATGVIYGMALSVASTVVLVRVLVDNRDLHTPAGHVAVGWLVVEDLFTVFALVLLPALYGPGAASGGALRSLAVAALKIAALVAVVFLLGRRLIPRIFERAVATKSRELFTLTVLVTALGIAVAAAALFEVSMALGAFLAGMVVGRSDFSLRAASEALPMRDAFAVLFFVSVGMLLDPRALIESPRLVAATLAVILIAKPLSAFILAAVLRRPLRVALTVSIALAQIGEFSFILATLGMQLGVAGPEVMNALVAAAILSITLNPLLYRLVAPLERALAPFYPAAARSAPERRSADGAGEDAQDDATHGEAGDDAENHFAILVGYGPSGRILSRLLIENRIDPVVIELNLDTVRKLRAEGVRAIYGDAGRPETLQRAGVERAAALILSAAQMQGSEEVVRTARELNPALRILARSHFLREAPALCGAGADEVYTGEGEVALTMTVAVLTALGATPEQIDRERERARRELGGAADGAACPRKGNGS